MKEATGELNITLITVIAIAAIAGLFYVFIWPAIKAGLQDNTCKTFGTGWTYKDNQCCPPAGQTGSCINVEDEETDTP